MIRTVTLNPALDRTVLIEDFTVDRVNRVSSSRLDVGGKGINVSKAILALGGASVAYGLVAGRAGDYVLDYLEARGIAAVFASSAGETRTNLKVVDPLRGSHTDINEAGPPADAAALAKLEEGLFADLRRGDICVLSGSAPAGVPKDIYARWTARAKAAGACCVVDADGDLLREAAKAGPELLKPNLRELEALAGRPLAGREARLGAMRELVAGGVGAVVLSLGSEGALFADGRSAFIAEGLVVAAATTVGAGDSMLAALVLSLEEGRGLEAMVPFAVAAGTAAVAHGGSGAFTAADVEAYMARVSYQTIPYNEERQI